MLRRKLGTVALAAALLFGSGGCCCVGAGEGDESRSTVESIVLGIAYLLGMATTGVEGSETAPETEIQNDEARVEEFVDSDAAIIYESVDGGIYRQRIDGSDREVIDASEKATVSSVSRDGRTIVSKHDGVQLYRRGSEPVAVEGIEGHVKYVRVSPDGEHVMVVRDEYSGNLDRDSWKVEIVDVADAVAGEVRSDLDTGPTAVGWEPDSSAFYLEVGRNGLRYDLEREEWTSLEAREVDWSQLYGSFDHRFDSGTAGLGERCEVDGDSVKLGDPLHDREGGLSWDEFEGLELRLEDGTSEVLVEMKVTEQLDDDSLYSCPFRAYQFTPDCEYVVFELADDDAIRVVEVESKTSGVIAEGTSARIVPAMH